MKIFLVEFHRLIKCPLTPLHIPNARFTTVFLRPVHSVVNQLRNVPKIFWAVLHILPNTRPIPLPIPCTILTTVVEILCHSVNNILFTVAIPVWIVCHKLPKNEPTPVIIEFQPCFKAPPILRPKPLKNPLVDSQVSESLCVKLFHQLPTVWTELSQPVLILFHILWPSPTNQPATEPYAEPSFSTKPFQLILVSDTPWFHQELILPPKELKPLPIQETPLLPKLVNVSTYPFHQLERVEPIAFPEPQVFLKAVEKSLHIFSAPV